MNNLENLFVESWIQLTREGELNIHWFWFTIALRKRNWKRATNATKRTKHRYLPCLALSFIYNDTWSVSYPALSSLSIFSTRSREKQVRNDRSRIVPLVPYIALADPESPALNEEISTQCFLRSLVSRSLSVVEDLEVEDLRFKI